MAVAETVKNVKTIKGACPHDCPDTCAWEVTVEDGRATKLVGAADHPFTHGGLCAKVNHYLDRVYGPERLLHPLRRVGPKGKGRFVQVGWDEAIADISGRLKEIVATHGGSAVLPYSYMGTQGLIQGSSIDRRFFNRIGATRLIRAVCAHTGSAGALSRRSEEPCGLAKYCSRSARSTRSPLSRRGGRSRRCVLSLRSTR